MFFSQEGGFHYVKVSAAQKLFTTGTIFHSTKVHINFERFNVANFMQQRKVPIKKYKAPRKKYANALIYTRKKLRCCFDTGQICYENNPRLKFINQTQN